MKKKLIIRLVIFIICVLLSAGVYFFLFPVTVKLSCCWNGPCPEPPFTSNQLLICCLISGIIFTILSIITICKIKKLK